MLSRIVPTIRRGHKLSSYCTTVIVCIRRLLDIVASLKKYTALLLYMSDEVTMLLYWYMIIESEY